MLQFTYYHYLQLNLFCIQLRLLAGFSSVTTDATVKRHSESQQNFTTNNALTSTSECRALQVHN